MIYAINNIPPLIFYLPEMSLVPMAMGYYAGLIVDGNDPLDVGTCTRED